MEEVIKIIKELQVSSGKRLQEILEENKDNQMLKDVLYFVYNPYIVTGLSSKKINKDVSNITLTKVPVENGVRIDITRVFDYLKFYNTGRDEDIGYIQHYLSFVSAEDRDIYEQIFTKELKLGITAKTINKVWEGFIPEFNVMLAEKYWNRMEELEEIKPNIIITQKLDGIRAIAKVFNGNIEIFSRQGNPIKGLLDIENELKELSDGFYDGELLLDKDDILSKDLYRETVTIVNSKDAHKSGVVFNIFDNINYSRFFKRKI